MVVRICKVFFFVFTIAYLLSLMVWLTGTFGWFGQEKDPLSAVFLVPLGLPWNRLVDLLPEVMWPWAAAAAPGVNMIVLAMICSSLKRRAGRT